MLSFENSFALLLFVGFPIFCIIKKRKLKRLAFEFSVLDWHTKEKIKHKSFLLSLSNFFFILAIIFLIIALSSPKLIQQKNFFVNNKASIMFLLDVSPSMSIQDMKTDRQKKISRFELAKETIKNFILKNKNIAVGLTLFASDSSLIIPETLSSEVFLQRLEQVSIGELGDGTALGDGLATALLHSSKEEDSYLVVLTDGENNAGAINPVDVTKIIAERKIKFYLIGIGSKVGGEIKYNDIETSKIYFGKSSGHFDEEKIKELATSANGFYNLATSVEALNLSFELVNKNLSDNILKESTTESTHLQKHFLFVVAILFILTWLIKKIFLRILL